jgi:hypothetical protein
MEPTPFSYTPNSNLHIEGFPDAVKLLKLGGLKAQRVADLCLHKNDLDFAADCLTALNRSSEEVVRTALWRSAVIHYMKCFGDSTSRFQLNAGVVLKGEPQEAMHAHRYFQDLRNKHMVHDENAYMQSTPAAVLNKREVPHKVEKIVCISLTAHVLGQENYNNLKLLIDKSYSWVVVQFDELCDLLTNELEAQPYDALFAMEGVTLRIPTVDDMAKSRGKLR